MAFKTEIVKTALPLIKAGMVVGFGGGSTVGELVRQAANHVRDIQVVTPSPTTRQLATVLGYQVLDTQYTERVDLAFDGCDALTADGSALKSGGGIHTNEKLIASLADQYILLAPKTRLHSTLPVETPIVLEVLPQSLGYVMREVGGLGGQAELRVATNRDGFTLTDAGNLLIDCHFPSYQQIKTLNQQLTALVGVVSTSYFDRLATDAILGDPETNQISRLADYQTD